jgi:hypothetical protein
VSVRTNLYASIGDIDYTICSVIRSGGAIAFALPLPPLEVNDIARRGRRIPI